MSPASRPPRSGRVKSSAKTATAGSEKVFKIGEAAKLVGVAPFVLRFWETQFAFLRPRHTPSKHRFYLEKDIAILKAVKRLLHKERFTIEGARKHIKEHGLEAIVKGTVKSVDSVTPRAFAGNETAERSLRRALLDVRRDLLSLRQKLSD